MLVESFMKSDLLISPECGNTYDKKEINMPLKRYYMTINSDELQIDFFCTNMQF